MTARRQVTGQGTVFWEDLDVGEELIGPGITMTEAHLVNWAGLTGDWVSLHLDADYAAICRLLSDALVRDSEFAPDYAELCARLCGLCADECSRHAAAHCKACSDACRACAEACRAMM